MCAVLVIYKTPATGSHFAYWASEVKRRSANSNADLLFSETFLCVFPLNHQTSAVSQYFLSRSVPQRKRFARSIWRQNDMIKNTVLKRLFIHMIVDIKGLPICMQ